MATCEFAVEGLIGDRWQLLGGAAGPMGCPLESRSASRIPPTLPGRCEPDGSPAGADGSPSGQRAVMRA